MACGGPQHSPLTTANKVLPLVARLFHASLTGRTASLDTHPPILRSLQLHHVESTSSGLYALPCNVLENINCTDHVN